MPDPSAINRVIQIAPEATPGTLVATTKKLASLGLTAAPAGEFQRVRPSGNRYPTDSLLNKHWTDFSGEGVPNFHELPYLFDGLYGVAAPTGTGPYTRAYTLASGSERTPKTYSLELSTGSRAETFAFFQFSGFTLELNRSEVTLSVTAFARPMTVGATPTAGNTQLESYVMGSADWELWIDPTSGALGTTQFTKALSFSFEQPELWAPTWYLNRNLSSFSSQVEAEALPTASLMLPWDATTETLYADLKGGATRFLRCRATHSYNAVSMTFTVDLAVKLAGFEEFSIEDNIYALGLTLDVVEDSGWAKAGQLGIVNSLAAVA